MSKFIDLSVTIEPTPPDLPPLMKITLERTDHQHGAGEARELFGVGPELLRDGEGWAAETLTCLGTHSSTHVDAPWHYNSKIGERQAEAIDELPLEWFFAPGVCLDFSAKEDGDAVTEAELVAELEQIGHTLAPLEIVLIRTGRDQFYGQPDYMKRGPGVSPEATSWLYEQGVRVVGIDAWGWDAPMHLQVEAAIEAGHPGVFWGAHQLGLSYSQIERLVGLEQLPPSGFTVACFPLKIAGGSAGPARVVAIVED
jgi:kynurenine formamidase